MNREVSEERPWDALSSGRVEDVKERLEDWATRLHAVAYWLQPIVPETAGRILETLTRPVIQGCGPLFPRRQRSGGPS